MDTPQPVCESFDAPPLSPLDLILTATEIWPDAIALRSGRESMTYRALRGRIEVMAAALQEAGVERDVPVGLCLERGFDFVVGMLGALQAGGAFLPLDPDWPLERLRFALEDSASPVVITTPERVQSLEAAGRRVVLPTALAMCAPEFARRDPDQLAYVIYTSGSTGAPKGVEILDRNLLHLIAWHLSAFEIRPDDRASCVAGLGFDAVMQELWPYLSRGASVDFPDEATRASPPALCRWLNERQITIALAPALQAEALMAAAWPANSALRLLLTGGDVLHNRPPAGLPFSVVNHYGPSECTVVASAGTVSPADRAAGAPTIGKPIAGVRILILDAQGRPVGPGEIGEIHIGGKGVGRGYRNRPEATAERFVPDPFSDAPHSALYRTGDYGRWLPDGELAFHGRHDGQVKIRGQRIELSEISVALNRHPDILQSAAIVRNDGANQRIVAYFVPATDRALKPGELREFLSSWLPGAMLPSGFVALPALPLNANGKLDRAALAEIEAMPDISDRPPFRAPESEVERILARLFAQQLEIGDIGLDDNFFLLGGHSLLASQLVLRSRDLFGVEVTLRDLFELQTVGNLAARINARILARLLETAGQASCDA